MASSTALPNATGRRYKSFAQAVADNDWLTDRWLRRAVQERRIPFFKVDGKLVFDQSELDGYVEAHRVDARR
ncbi:MAG TPA: hypothetical protein VNF71_00965 [Acidimicrobiales bacterium]|nr:hypothetical protein [Acidimicrobiales bacterium]